MGVWLTQPGSGKSMMVSEESADDWRALGYLDKEMPKPDPKPMAKKKVEKTTAARKPKGAEPLLQAGPEDTKGTNKTAKDED